MPSELYIKHIPAIAEHFSITCNRAAAFDLIITLRTAGELLENLPESVTDILAAFEAQYGEADWPTGIPPLDVPDQVDDDTRPA